MCSLSLGCMNSHLCGNTQPWSHLFDHPVFISSSRSSRQKRTGLRIWTPSPSPSRGRPTISKWKLTCGAETPSNMDFLFATNNITYIHIWVQRFAQLGMEHWYYSFFSSTDTSNSKSSNVLDLFVLNSPYLTHASFSLPGPQMSNGPRKEKVFEVNGRLSWVR